VAAGSNHSLALTRDGRAYQWGQRLFLQPSPVDRCYGAPGADRSGEDLHAAVLAAGDASVSAIVDTRGRVFSWGKNMGSGILGHYGAGSRLATFLEALAGVSVSQVSFGARHAAAIVGTPAAVRGLGALPAALAAAAKR